jgi:predicted PurR-regulated permease PerM
MVLLSVVPAVGPALVWMPATLYFFAVGQYVQGAILFIVGGVVIDPIIAALFISVWGMAAKGN